MTKNIFFAVLFLLSICALCDESVDVVSNHPPKKWKHMLSIPTYPGMILFNYDHSNFSHPIATILKVFKTQDGSSLDKEKVISFYKEFYKKRGWVNGVYERRGNEPYLSLMATAYVPDGKCASIHVAGHLYFWLAPKDGMLTIYMSQWRISSLRQRYQTIFNNVVEKLKQFSEEISYSLAYTPSAWPEYYQNEYLVDCKVFSIIRKSKKTKGCFLDKKDIIDSVILAYMDSKTAKEQAEIYEDKSSFHYGQRRIVVQDDNILIVLTYDDSSHDSLVKELVEKLKMKHHSGSTRIAPKRGEI